MRKFIVTLCYALPLWGIAQNPEIKSELPNVIPPSPTVAALMKFNEIEISQYTGVPDISVSLFETKTRSNEIKNLIKLSYHIANIKADDVSTDVGLGWSLSYGGTISRTTKDLPDEIKTLSQSYLNGIQGHKGRFGIYHNNSISNTNRFYELLNLERGNTNISLSDTERKKFYWEDVSLGKYDTEHDIWQYNFMGYSGNFTIEKNITTNLLEVKNKTSNGLKIVNIYDSSTFEPQSFIVYDPKGNKYEFDIVEESSSTIFSDIKYYFFGSYISSPESFISLPINVRSAFHLSKIYDKNNNLIIEYIYNDENERMTEITEIRSFEYNYSIGVNGPETVLDYLTIYDPNNLYQLNKVLEPKERFTVNKIVNNVKKIKQIKIIGLGKYIFEWDSNRSDFYEVGYAAYKLNSIIEKNLDDEVLSKYEFNYFYNNKNVYNRNKLFLGEIKKYDKFLLQYTSQKLEYEFLDYMPNLNLGIDYWGYHNEVKPYDFKYYTKKVTPLISTLGVLRKIVHPTKGCTVFEYEPNSYSYIGSQLLTNFNDNPDNWDENILHLEMQSLNNQYNLFHIQDEHDVEIRVANNNIFNTYSDFRFLIYKKDSLNNFVLYKYIEPETVLSNNFFFSTKLIEGDYKIALSSLDVNFPNNFSLNVDFTYKTKKSQQLNYVYGGGNRVKSISYFDVDVDINNLQFTPTKKKTNFEYLNGSLVYGLPVFEYIKTLFTLIRFPGSYSGSYFNENIFEVKYRTVSTNSLNVNFKTYGSDVGYKNVKSFENGNGHSEYDFTSAIEFPEDEEAYNRNYPFYPSKNIDYKRGLLKELKIFDSNGRILQFIKNDYQFDEANLADEITGFTSYITTNNCAYNHLFNTYEAFENVSRAYNSLEPCPDVFTNMGIKFIYSSYGWAKLESKETKNYFYDANNTQSEVVTRESFQYNPLNKMIAEHKVINSLGEETVSSYDYLTDPAALAQNRIAEIEQIKVNKNNEILSTSKIVYSNTFAGNTNVHLPSVIQTSKGGITLENKIRYNRYDTYGNPLEVQQENGMLISYIYGYHNTQVVAKIENIGYTSIPTNLITAIQNATDAATYSESAVLSALDALRNDSALANSMVTTVTHIPLVGVSTMTTPNGIRMQYHYDSMNRLEKVTDHHGNIVTENSYNYRP
ncbi:hypothetical protein [Flavobacterium stagni]|uniref:YD repeat-containing protein n=1 Tax=Flavobacterium stagni TaxID=2506421 RepID=A0A4Q1K6K4_9FLAO|nr:hypothetical protein [Flavobacterium stagni]RXR21460.1 hypothetical protein EQG61_12105 [Flavobacterium stagni]